MKNPLTESRTPDGMWLATGFGKGGDELVVETSEAAKILDRYTDEYEASLTPIGSQENANGSGVIDIAAERAARVRGCSPDAAKRRFWAIRKEESTNVSLDWYEAFLIALDTSLSETEEIPIFPAGRIAARDMIEVRAEELSEIEQHQLARSLWNFTRGYMSAVLHEKKQEQELGAAA